MDFLVFGNISQRLAWYLCLLKSHLMVFVPHLKIMMSSKLMIRNQCGEVTSDESSVIMNHDLQYLLEMICNDDPSRFSHIPPHKPI
jgi:hypothetical protein